MATPLLESVAATSAIAAAAAERPDDFKAFHGELNQRLRSEVDEEFYGHWDVTPSPFVLDQAAFQQVRGACRQIFTVVEKIIHLYLEGQDDVGELFARYELFRPYMTKRNLSWQEYGRYDFLVTPEGIPVLCELNTAMASGYLPMFHVNQVFHESAPDFLRPNAERVLLPYDHESALGEQYCRMEALANSDYGAVAILVDENAKYHESQMIKQSLEDLGREVVIGNVKDTHSIGHNLFLDDVRISSTYNKFRLFGLQHHWSEQAYLDNRRFLEAIRRNDILAVNNFAAMTISEDKSIFAAMRLPAVQAALDPDEKVAVETHTPATYVLKPGLVEVNGESIDLISWVKADKDEFILKPRSDYRGNGVMSGREHEPAEFAALVDQLADEGLYLAQRRIDSAMFDITHVTEDGEVATLPMRMAGGLYFAEMDFHGIVARLAPWEIVNAIKHAYVLPVSCTA